MGCYRHHGAPPRTDGRDPVAASSSAIAYGRIGLVAWALFEAGGGHVITFDKMGRKFSIEVDAPQEREGFLALVASLVRATPRIAP